VTAVENPDENVPDLPRRRGRPRRDIDLDAVADAVGALFVEGGYEAVSIGSTAERLQVSRATLYRTVPTKQDLLGILFERGTQELTLAVTEMLERGNSPEQNLHELIRIQVDAAIRMRRYLPVFFGGAGLPPDVFTRWQRWSREFEGLWVGVVRRAMSDATLPEGDPVLTARLMLGMCLWISRWYRPGDGYDATHIAETVIRLQSRRDVPA
jgi:AcrR family transcriptional regulator